MNKILLAGLMAMPVMALSVQPASAEGHGHGHAPGVCYHTFKPNLVIPVPYVPAFKPKISFYCPECNGCCLSKCCKCARKVLGCPSRAAADCGPTGPWHGYWPDSHGPLNYGPYAAPGPYASQFQGYAAPGAAPGVPSYWYGR